MTINKFNVNGCEFKNTTIIDILFDKVKLTLKEFKFIYNKFTNVVLIKQAQNHNYPISRHSIVI